MNLSEALDAALPEIPRTRLTQSRPPRLDPDLIIREDVLDGEAIVGVLQRDRANYFRFPPEQWKLALLFDGARSYEEIADLYAANTGGIVTPDDVRAFAENMTEADFWYKSPQERNLAMSEKLMSQRSRRAARQSKIDLAHISFSAWDPDSYLTWLDRKLGRFLYSRWAFAAVILLFLFETTVYLSQWSTLGPDMELYFNFTRKSFLDIVQFWVLFLVLGFFHESAHGLTCKHYGGEVHSMGLMFLYLTPAFYVDVTESWISATRVQRLATIIAGVWVELVICGFAMIVWINTLPGRWLHDFAYQIVLLTGIAVVVVNFNPLIKLDGYYFFTEFLGIPELKERSSAFLSGWFQNRILRLPVEVPVVPRRRVAMFTIYAALSGAYSYFLLFFIVRFSYNVASKWLAEFAIIPAGYLAFAVFRSRLRALRDLGYRLWAEHIGPDFRFRPVHFVAIVALLCLLFLPLWRDREDAIFVVEPAEPQTVHAAIAGKVTSVLVGEGDRVYAGQPLLRMTSADASTMRAGAEAQTQGARFTAYESELRGDSVGSSSADVAAARRAGEIAASAQTALILAAPADGIILNEDPEALRDQDVGVGQALIEVADPARRVVRLYVPAVALQRIPAGAEVVLAPPGRFSFIRTRLAPLLGEAVTLPPGLIAHQDYKGVLLPTYYTAVLPLAGSDLPFGMSGTARIFGERRSVFSRMARVVTELFHMHIW